MNRKERRAALKRGKSPPFISMTRQAAGVLGIDDLATAARQTYWQGQFAQAADTCRAILARAPAHAESLNLLGLISQASNQHDVAIGNFAKAIRADGGNVVYHVNIASSYQALGRWDKASAHFTRAITLGLDDNSVVQFVTQTPVIAGCLRRIAEAWPRPLTSNELFGSAGVVGIANQALLPCMLKTVWVCNATLEHFLTHVRSFLLQCAAQRPSGLSSVDNREFELYCALAQQCFINEYVFAQSDDETRQATALRDMLNDGLAAGSEISPLLLVAVAAYFPLHALAMAESLLQRAWPDAISDLLQQQIREPLEERRDRDTIPALTAIDDNVSLQVRQQYEENPFPRWTVIPPVALRPSQLTYAGTERSETLDILIAGCGTGKNSIDAAMLFPQARVLAIDISLASLAYAKRKTREAGLKNIDYGQADILKLSALGRTFDRIEVGGVLHHLADPEAGWRVLVSILRPGGVMNVGLYSEIARRAIVAGRALIAQRGYPATVGGIRALRQEVFRSKDGTIEKSLTTYRDFYSTSGCRDLLFNVMEHRFTLPRIKAFLAAHDLTFLGFEAEPEILAAFKRRFPDPAVLTDLDRWHAFETDNPDTFISMYRFLVRKNR